MKIPTPRPCAECGDGAIFHGLTYFSIVIDEFMAPLTTPGPLLNGVDRLFGRLEKKVTPHILECLMHTGLASRVLEPDDHTPLLALMLWNEAKERGIHVEEVRLFDLPRNIFIATFPNGKKIAYEGIPDPAHLPKHVPWMDDKATLKEKFRARGLPVAKGGAATNVKSALKIFKTLTPPVIVKPFSGSASRHTTLHIVDELELARAVTVALQVAPRAVVEEELVGPVYRATVVDGKFVAAIRRDQPRVIGDGVHTVRALVETANTHPKRQGPYFHHIKLDTLAEAELAWQKLTTDAVPEKGRVVLLNQKINWSVGGTTADVTAETHPDNIALFEEVARVLKAPIVGLDFIITDIAKSWKVEERCGILECNSMPFFDNHHLPFEGEPQNVAAKIWDMVEGR